MYVLLLALCLGQHPHPFDNLLLEHAELFETIFVESAATRTLDNGELPCDLQPGERLWVPLGVEVFAKDKDYSAKPLDWIAGPGVFRVEATGGNCKVVVGAVATSVGGTFRVVQGNGYVAEVQTGRPVSGTFELDSGVICHGTFTATSGNYTTGSLGFFQRPVKGSSEIILEPFPLNWEVGDTLYFGSPESRMNTGLHWSAQIASLTQQGTQAHITLSAAMPYDYSIVPSEIPASAIKVVNPKKFVRFTVTPSTEAHAMFMHPSGRCAMEGVGWYGYGITDNRLPDSDATKKKLRYGPHAHFLGYGHHFHTGESPFRVEDCSFIGNGKSWQIVIHSTPSAYLQRNTIVNAGGAGVMVEFGDETGQVNNTTVLGTYGIDRALAIDDKTNIGGDNGPGIWSQSGAIVIDGVTAIGAMGAAVSPYPLTRLRTPGDSTTAAKVQVADLEHTRPDLFAAFTAIGRTEATPWECPVLVRNVTSIGCRLVIDAAHINRGAPIANMPSPLIENVVGCTTRGNFNSVQTGGCLYYFSRGIISKNFKIYGRFDSTSFTGFEVWNNNADHRFENCTVKGFGTGIEMGFGNTAVVGGMYQNVKNINLSGIIKNDPVQMSNNRNCVIDGLTFLPVTYGPVANRKDITMASRFATLSTSTVEMAFQPDQTLWKRAGQPDVWVGYLEQNPNALAGIKHAPYTGLTSGQIRDQHGKILTGRLFDTWATDPRVAGLLSPVE